MFGKGGTLNIQAASFLKIKEQEQGRLGTQSIAQIRMDRPAHPFVLEHLKVDLYRAMGSAANDIVDSCEPFARLATRVCLGLPAIRKLPLVWDADGLHD